jgi:ADP-ribose pyrophosphatase YjhB (NUDIX family)
MERHEVLARVRASLGPDGVGQYCFVCGAPGLTTETTDAGEIFVCQAAGHRSPRAFLFDGRAIETFEDGELVHDTAGALIRRGSAADRHTLLFLRRKFPLRYTVPAGHIEWDCDPETEMRREVAEETGLVVRQAVRILPGETLLLADPCRRGADLHRWHLFEVEAEGQPCLSDEGRILGWYSDDEIRAFATRGMLTAAVHAIVARLGLA